MKPPTFATLRELWADLLDYEQRGWVLRDDGRVLCPIHAQVAQCDERGHVVGPWTEHPLDDEIDWRYCQRCGSEFEQRSLHSKGGTLVDRPDDSHDG